MSAFLMSKTDIDILVTAFARLKPHGRKLLNLNAFGLTLWRENAASVTFRYRHKPRAELEAAFPDLAVIERYRFKTVLARPEAVAQIAACYDYQTCEHDGYEASEARQIYLAIAAAYPETMPGAGEMPWGVSNRDDLERVKLIKRIRMSTR